MEWDLPVSFMFRAVKQKKLHEKHKNYRMKKLKITEKVIDSSPCIMGK